MRRILLAASVFLVFSILGYWIGRVPFQESKPAKVQMGTSKTQAFSLADLPTENPANIHKFLFDESFSTQAHSPLFWEKSMERMKGEYPKAEAKFQVNYTRELVTRLSLIRAIGGLENFSQERFLFLNSVLETKQPWIIHREALHQLLPLLRGKDEKVRNAILAKVDSRVRGLASLTSRELLLQLGEQK
jgi:hypothetical protein